MGKRVQGYGTLTVFVFVVGLAGIGLATTEDDPEMCPPVTIDDLFPEEPETTTTTGTTPTTTTTVPVTTTTVPVTATTGSPTSTTKAPPTTTTTTDTTLPPQPPCSTPFVYPMVFPLFGDGAIISEFGAARDGGRRHHLGTDIAAAKLQPVVAVASGTVTRVAGDSGISGYRIHLRHDDGWHSLYIHLNNDTAGTDDGNGLGIRADLVVGDEVDAGQILGWNGDSGNAEGTVPHLHFELRGPDGEPIDPGASLEAATRLPEAPFLGPFIDLTPGEVPTALELLLSRGVPVWCDDPARVCPDDPATAGGLASWLEVLTGVEGVWGEESVWWEPEAQEADDPTACVTEGTCRDQAECDTDCDEPALTEAEIARALAWGRLRTGYDKRMGWMELGIPDAAWSTPPMAPPERPYQLSLERTHEILGGPSRCLTIPDPDRELSRADAADLVLLYLGWSEQPQCPTSVANR